MSRRFGRNQKRRMRAELAAAQETGVKLERTISSIRAAGQDNEYAVKLTADILGQHFVALPPQQMKMSRGIGQLVKLQKMEDPRCLTYAGAQDFAPQLCSALMELETFDVSAHKNELRDMVHLRVQNQRGEWAYAISRAALENVPHDYLVRKIAHELAIAIAATLRPRAAA